MFFSVCDVFLWFGPDGPEDPEEPEDPDNPDSPDNPEEPEYPDNPESPDDSGGTRRGQNECFVSTLQNYYIIFFKIYKYYYDNDDSVLITWITCLGEGHGGMQPFVFHHIKRGGGRGWIIVQTTCITLL